MTALAQPFGGFHCDPLKAQSRRLWGRAEPGLELHECVLTLHNSHSVPLRYILIPSCVAAEIRSFCYVPSASLKPGYARYKYTLKP